MNYSEFRIRLGNRIKELRQEQGLSLLDMESGRYGVHRRTVQEAENNNQDIRMETLFKIARRLNVEIQDFLDFKMNI